ncbi:MAG: TetR family transcriptional regulator [Pseudonocardiaceae bacterium]|nr:TetR family transcriptional regulator [Pseudonocardiaceae bacterium]
MPRRTDARERVLRTAGALLRSQGYHGTGLNQVLTESRAPKGSLYFHFPGGKEQLATESIELTGAELRRLLERLLASANTPREALHTVTEALAAELDSSDYRDGCPIATVALESCAGHDPVRKASEDVYRSWLNVVTDYLRDNGFDSERAKSRSVLIIAALEGALLLAKTQRDTAPLRTVADQLGDLIDEESS